MVAPATPPLTNSHEGSTATQLSPAGWKEDDVLQGIDQTDPAPRQRRLEIWRASWLALVILLAVVPAHSADSAQSRAKHDSAMTWHAVDPVEAGSWQQFPMSLRGHSLVAGRDGSTDGLRIAVGSEFAGAWGAGTFLSDLAPLGWRESDGQLQLLGLNEDQEVVLEEIELRITLPDDPILIERTASVLDRLVLPEDPVVIEPGVLSPPGIPIGIRREPGTQRLGFLGLAPELELGLVTSWSESGELQGATLVSLGESDHPSVPAHARAPGARAGSERGHVPGPIPIDILRAFEDSALAGTLRDAWLEGRLLRVLVERETARASTELVLLSAFLPDDLDEPLAVAERVLFERDGLALTPGTLARLRLEAAGGDTVGNLVGWSSLDDPAGSDEPSELSWTYVPEIPIPPTGAGLPAPPFPIDTERGGRGHAGRYVPQVPEPIDFLPAPPFPIDTERGGRARAGRHVPQVPEPIDFGAGDASIGTLHVNLPSPSEPIELLAGLRVAGIVVSGPAGPLYEAQFGHAPEGGLSTAWWSDGRIVRFHGLDAGSLPAVLLEGADAAPIVLHVPHLPADVAMAVLLPSASDDAPSATRSVVPEDPEDTLRAPAPGALRVLLPSAIEPPFEPIDWRSAVPLAR